MDRRRERVSLDKVYDAVLRIERKLEYYLGTFSRFVGISAELLTQSIVERVSKLGGLHLEDIVLPKLEIVESNIKTNSYEIDLLCKDPEGRFWIVETTTYPILRRSQVDKFVRRIRRWINDKGGPIGFILFAYGGIDAGYARLLMDNIRGLVFQSIILDRYSLEKLLNALGIKKRFY